MGATSAGQPLRLGRRAGLVHGAHERSGGRVAKRERELEPVAFELLVPQVAQGRSPCHGRTPGPSIGLGRMLCSTSEN
jgi:hypothetical protein